MNSKQMQTEIDKLKAEENLSKGAAARLRDLERALPDQKAREARKAAARVKGQAYGATATVHHGPVDDGLEGNAWISFFNRYVDTKGLCQAKPGDGPVRESSRKERSGKPGTFSFNGRSVILHLPATKRSVKVAGQIDCSAPTVARITARRKATPERKTDGNRLDGFAFGPDRGLEIIKLADAGKLAQLGERRVKRLTPKLDRLRELLAGAGLYAGQHQAAAGAY